MPSQAKIALEWLARDPLFLDTETTGLDHTAEVCDLAVIDAAGQVLVNTLIRTVRPIQPSAYAIHGIGDADLAAAPTFAEVVDQLRAALSKRLVVIYNKEFDLKMLTQTHRLAKVPAQHLREAEFVCAMQLYAAHYGEWNSYHGSYRWQTLEKAARQCRLRWETSAHRALADAEMCRKLVRHMAGVSAHTR
jgi:DNA polymerase-3 subunit epsilon